MLVVDVVASTELFETLGVDASDAVRRDLFGVFADEIIEHGGTLVKTMGDGCLASFGAAADAVGAAVALHVGTARLARRRCPGLQLRAGAAVGDVTEDGGDVFGPAVITASRLCNAAAPGQVLVTDLVRGLAGDRGGHHYDRVGELLLKGIAEPVAASAVQWDDIESDRPPIPEPLAPRATELLVGRHDERVQLQDAWKAVVGGERRLVMVAGEPGIGKTRLVADAARRAYAEGAVVLFGRCEEDLAVPYQPFVEALRPAIAAVDPAVLRDHTNACGGELGRVLPDLLWAVPNATPPVKADAELERLRLFDAFTDLLRRLAQLHHLVLVLDDIHWAAPATVQLLRHLVGTEGLPMFVVCTYRDTEIDRGHALGGVLSDVHRQEGVERLGLKGLDRSGVEEYLEAASGDTLDADVRQLAVALHERCAGNPFFTGQVLRHLVEQGALVQERGRWRTSGKYDEVGLPEGVLDVVGRRLSHLSETANRALTVAAVAGLEFPLRLVAGVPDLAPDLDALVDALDEAVAIRLLTESGGRYAFAHAIVRETLLRELTTARRARIHRQLAHSLVAMHGDSPGPHLAELAHHFTEAAILGDVASATKYACLAADAAFHQTDLMGAAAILERTIPVVEAVEPVDQEARSELCATLAAIGTILMDQRYRAASTNALDAARRLGSPERFVRAAVAGRMRRAGVFDEELAALCREGLGLVGPDDHALRALMLEVLAAQELMADDAAGWDHQREALAIADTLEDEAPVLVAFVRTWASMMLMGDADVAARRRLIESTKALRDRPDPHWEAIDPYRIVFSYDLLSSVRAIIRLTEGDRAGFEADVNEIGEQATKTGNPIMRGWYHMVLSLIAMMDGRFEDAHRSNDSMLEVAAVDESFRLSYLAILMHLAYEEGTFGALAGAVGAAAEDNPGIPAFVSLHARALLEAGRLDEGRTVLDGMLRHLDGYTHNWLWPIVPAYLAEVAAGLGAAEHAPALLAALEPFAGQLNVVTPGIALIGAFDRYRGMLLTLLDRHDEAVASLEAAIDLEEGVDAPPVVARSRCWLAIALRARGAPGDEQRAKDEASACLDVAGRLGMVRLAAGAEAFLAG